jgi:hypothetical protein
LLRDVSRLSSVVATTLKPRPSPLCTRHRVDGSVQ